MIEHELMEAYTRVFGTQPIKEQVVSYPLVTDFTLISDRLFDLSIYLWTLSKCHWCNGIFYAESRSLSAVQAGNDLSITRQTATKYLRTLKERGFMKKDPITGLVFIDDKMFQERISKADFDLLSSFAEHNTQAAIIYFIAEYKKNSYQPYLLNCQIAKLHIGIGGKDVHNNVVVTNALKIGKNLNILDYQTNSGNRYEVTWINPSFYLLQHKGEL